MSANSTAVLDRAASPRFEGPLPDAGQVSAVVDAANVALTFSYDNNGNRTEVWDALNHRTTYVYESNSNRLQAVVNALGHTVTHYYDAAGRQTAVQDARGYLTSFSYDNAGRLYTQTDPLNHVTTYLYDAAGRNTTLVAANGAVKTTTFDAAGRVVSLLYADGKRVTLQYDAGGRRTTMVDWDGTTTYAYSARGELTGKTVPGGWSLTMVYDAVGNRVTLVEASGYAFTYGYDALNRCIRLRDPNAYVISFQYDAAGRRTTLLDSTGAHRVYAYDPVGRLTTQVDYDGASNPIVTFVDGYDTVGNRTSRVKDGVATTWVYDAAYRLTNQQKSSQTATFVYDPAGNITVKHHEGSSPMTMAYDAANRLVTMQQGSNIGTYTFDANGNMTLERIDAIGVLATWVYDGENRPINEIRSSSVRHTYAYEPDGLRRSAFHAGASDIVTFVWDGNDLLNEMIEGGVAARYAVVDGEVLSEKRGAYRYLFVPDPLGSVNHLLDTTPAIAATYVYWPYGEVLSHSGADTKMQFVGALGYYTGTANRVYVVARFYRPDLGRWQTRDPIGYEGGDWNLYRYCRGAPSTCVDPDGRQRVPPGQCAKVYGRRTRRCYECVYHYQIERGGMRHKAACESANAACGTNAPCNIGHFSHDRPPGGGAVPPARSCRGFLDMGLESCYQACVRVRDGLDDAGHLQDCCSDWCERCCRIELGACMDACEAAIHVLMEGLTRAQRRN